jgi:quercetin dioxygenase-like cupin family protein
MIAEPTTQPVIATRTLENSIWYLGPNLFSILMDGQATGGAYSLLHLTSPKGAEPPPHTHSREDEVFFILRGRIRGTIGEMPFEAGPGTLIHLPRNTQHGWTIESDELEMLTWFTPAGCEEYFRHPEISRPAEDLTLGPPLQDPGKYVRAAELLAEYGVSMPPPSAQ